MDYNAIMRIITSRSDAVRLIRVAALLLIGYVIILFSVNLLFQSPQSRQSPQQIPQRTSTEQETTNQTSYEHLQPLQMPQDTWRQQTSEQKINYSYYILFAGAAVICLILAYWPWLQLKLKQGLIPVVVVILAISPVIVNQFAGGLSPLGPRFSSPEATTLATFPFLFVALLLAAWQYKWQYTLFIILGITALNLGVRWSSAGPRTQLFQGILAVILIQTVIFLVVGFSISFLMSRLRAQQQSLEDANNRLTQYASTLEQLATSRERNRLALELHDTLAHTLSGLSVQLETAKAYWDVDKPMAHSILEKSLKATHQGLEETRRALKSLRASPLDDLGLALALKKMAEDAASRGSLVLDMPETILVPPLSPDVEHCIYRVAQEAITNVIKHASAKKLSVKLEFVDGGAQLSITDDGVGFDINKIDKTSHFGLAGMRERAQIAGGEFGIMSKPGAGTTVILIFKQVMRS
jgi:signal transduction histidine kinase